MRAGHPPFAALRQRVYIDYRPARRPRASVCSRSVVLGRHCLVLKGPCSPKFEDFPPLKRSVRVTGRRCYRIFAYITRYLTNFTTNRVWTCQQTMFAAGRSGIMVGRRPVWLPGYWFVRVHSTLAACCRLSVLYYACSDEFTQESNGLFLDWRSLVTPCG